MYGASGCYNTCYAMHVVQHMVCRVVQVLHCMVYCMGCALACNRAVVSSFAFLLQNCQDLVGGVAENLRVVLDSS